MRRKKKGNRRGKQENISHLTPTVTTSASHSGFNVLWAKPPHRSRPLCHPLLPSSTLDGPPASYKLYTTSKYERWGRGVIFRCIVPAFSRCVAYIPAKQAISSRFVSLCFVVSPALSLAILQTLFTFVCILVFLYLAAISFFPRKKMYFPRSTGVHKPATRVFLSQPL